MIETVEKFNIKEMAEKVQTTKETTAELQSISGGIQAVDRKVGHIITNVKNLEMNISDIFGIV